MLTFTVKHDHSDIELVLDKVVSITTIPRQGAPASGLDAVKVALVDGTVVHIPEAQHQAFILAWVNFCHYSETIINGQYALTRTPQ